MGKKQRVQRLSMERESKFPLLSASYYEVTSKETCRYNCIAYVAGDRSQWWQPPIINRPTYWPEDAISDYSLEALVSVFETLGYTTCSNGRPEVGFEKIVLYIGADGEWTHAAKQEKDGSWSSKLGDWEDISHATVEAIEGPAYGKAVQYMKRALGKRGKAIQE